ncbi:MAG TPA: YggT family protein [Pyrinomonadaceae bacterium]|nr:YggT family protein [Pyrinomonadaceae bacterium]
MLILQALFNLVWYLIVATIVAVIALMVVRFVLNYADLNPFGRPVILVRRLTDPFVNPVRRSLLSLGAQPNIAPLVVVLLTILLGYFVLMLAVSLLDTAAGLLLAATSGRAGGVVAMMGYLLYGLLSLYGLLIFVRIIFSWGQVSYTNRLMRFLVNATDPLLTPLRRTIPPIGMFDISPIVAFILIWLFQAAIAMTLLRGWRLSFFL